MRKAAFHTLGCKVNSYETEAMQQLLEAAGYEIVPFSQRADVYIINTCSVTNVADRKSRQMLHRAKKMNPEAVVVAAGCYVQAAGETLKTDAAVDLMIGNNCKTDLVKYLNEYFSEKADQHIIEIGEAHEYEELSISKIAGHTRAFIKVQDGCNQFCSYCIIPYTRGRVRSRRPEAVVSEIRTLVAGGYQEVVLTGIHLSSYGVDFSEPERETLLTLIEKIHGIEGLKRIRLGSLEPRIVTAEFAASLAAMKKVCPHFHLSLQSGCDETLKRMNRHYSTADYALRCGYLRAAFDHPAITTDVIVGFPGETDEEFAVTKAFLKQIGFYEMHIFKYSKREGTRAASMPEQIPEPVKAKRSDILMELERQMSTHYRERFFGMEKEILLEESLTADGQQYMTGHTREYVKAAVPWEEDGRNKMVTGLVSGLLSDEVLLAGPNSEA